MAVVIKESYLNRQLEDLAYGDKKSEELCWSGEATLRSGQTVKLLDGELDAPKLKLRTDLVEAGRQWVDYTITFVGGYLHYYSEGEVVEKEISGWATTLPVDIALSDFAERARASGKEVPQAIVDQLQRFQDRYLDIDCLYLDLGNLEVLSSRATHTFDGEHPDPAAIEAYEALLRQYLTWLGTKLKPTLLGIVGLNTASTSVPYAVPTGMTHSAFDSQATPSAGGKAGGRYLSYLLVARWPMYNRSPPMPTFANQPAAFVRRWPRSNDSEGTMIIARPLVFGEWIYKMLTHLKIYILGGASRFYLNPGEIIAEYKSPNQVADLGEPTYRARFSVERVPTFHHTKEGKELPPVYESVLVNWEAHEYVRYDIDPSVKFRLEAMLDVQGACALEFKVSTDPKGTPIVSRVLKKDSLSVSCAGRSLPGGDYFDPLFSTPPDWGRIAAQFRNPESVALIHRAYEETKAKVSGYMQRARSFYEETMRYEFAFVPPGAKAYNFRAPLPSDELSLIDDQFNLQLCLNFANVDEGMVPSADLAAECDTHW